MLPVLDKIKRRTRREVLNILLIQNGHDHYCKHFAHLDNVNIYIYNGSSWSIPQELTPANFLLIQDTGVPFVGCFDKIICIGRAREAQVSLAIQKKFGLELILINNSSEETYCPMPFTFQIKEKVQMSPNAQVSMSKYLGQDKGTTILPIGEHTDISKKEDSVVIFNHAPAQVVQNIISAYQGSQFLEFSPDTLSGSKVFLDTIVGLTPHLIEAMSYGCIPIVPYCREVEKLLEGKGYIYKDYKDISPLIHKALASNTSQHEIRKIADSCFTDKQDFINKWNHILGRSI